MATIPTIAVDLMSEVDRLMVEDMRVELLQTMENAGGCPAEYVRSELGGELRRRRVVVLAVRSGSGGGAWPQPAVWRSGAPTSRSS